MGGIPFSKHLYIPPAINTAYVLRTYRNCISAYKWCKWLTDDNQQQSATFDLEISRAAWIGRKKVCRVSLVSDSTISFGSKRLLWSMLQVPTCAGCGARSMDPYGSVNRCPAESPAIEVLQTSHGTLLSLEISGAPVLLHRLHPLADVLSPFCSDRIPSQKFRGK